jgi:hypothetical protein
VVGAPTPRPAHAPALCLTHVLRCNGWHACVAQEVIEDEEVTFNRTLLSGLKYFEKVKARLASEGSTVVSGKDVRAARSCLLPPVAVTLATPCGYLLLSPAKLAGFGGGGGGDPCAG